VIEDELRSTLLFQDVGDEGVAVASAGGVVEVEAGQILAQAGDQGAGMYIVLDGEVAIDVRGRQFSVGPGSFFGELSLLVPGAPRVARVRAATRARLVPVSRAAFDRLLESEPSFASAMLREVARRLIAAEDGTPPGPAH
jgi:CRP-like cAMP-binding protein